MANTTTPGGMKTGSSQPTFDAAALKREFPGLADLRLHYKLPPERGWSATAAALAWLGSSCFDPYVIGCDQRRAGLVVE